MALLISATILNSCNDPWDYNDDDECNYEDCNTLEPTEGKFIVKVTCDLNYPSVPITIYKGYYDTGSIFLQDTLYGNPKTYLLPLNQYYTIAAIYDTPSGQVIAVDGGELKKSQYYECDSTCWKENEVKVNVQLKK